MPKGIYKRSIKYSREQLEPLSEQKLSSKQIAEILGANPKYIDKLRRKYDLPRMKNGEWQTMEKNYFWKGGIIIDKNGYVLIKSPDHPYRNSIGYVREHRLLMEKHLKRYLSPKEVVHHLNGKPADNRIENLELFQTNGKHLHKELKGKIPKWTPEGKAKLLEVVRQPRVRKVSSNRSL